MKARSIPHLDILGLDWSHDIASKEKQQTPMFSEKYGRDHEGYFRTRMKSQDELKKDGQNAEEVKDMIKGLRDLVIVG